MPVQRVLAGRRVVKDGQTLATDTQLMLRLERLVREPAAETQPIPEGRRTSSGRPRWPAATSRSARSATSPWAICRAASTSRPVRTTAGPPTCQSWGRCCCSSTAAAGSTATSTPTTRPAGSSPSGPAFECSRSTTGWPRSTRSPRRTTTRSRPTAGWSKNAESIGADPERLAVGGDSAGGCLAASRRSRPREEGLPLAFQLLVYPGTDMRGGSESRALFAEGFYLTKQFMDLAREMLHPRPGAARGPARLPVVRRDPRRPRPAYVVTAGFDPLRDEGEAYARRLAEAGVQVELGASPTRSTASSTWSA